MGNVRYLGKLRAVVYSWQVVVENALRCWLKEMKATMILGTRVRTEYASKDNDYYEGKKPNEYLCWAWWLSLFTSSILCMNIIIQRIKRMGKKDIKKNTKQNVCECVKAVCALEISTIVNMYKACKIWIFCEQQWLLIWKTTETMCSRIVFSCIIYKWTRVVHVRCQKSYSTYLFYSFFLDGHFCFCVLVECGLYSLSWRIYHFFKLCNILLNFKNYPWNFGNVEWFRRSHNIFLNLCPRISISWI